MAEYKTYEQKMRFYKSSEWQSLRQQALERDIYECQECKRQSGKVKTKQRLDVDHIKDFGSQIIMINVDQPGWIKELDGEDRQELLVVNKYITHSTNNYGHEGLVNINDIVDRAIDNKGYLIIFVKNNAVGYQR
ncbi:HNH endonuclease [Neobacillus massiliamazoniensis]|uniref:Gp65 n=1 Tax=Neobacillus massiliamazoniensis TaxID=1499688 RepID=A0A0U1NRE1_9BACI|nr:hypothetical protein [Neobacillus massiliamazoniensis]CRK80318.1 gp65 [Neobacillus massiliamazoniensis]